MQQEEYINTYWKEAHRKGCDNSGLDAVCCPGHVSIFNKMVDHFQRKSFARSLDAIGSLNGVKALDIGCGTGRWARLLFHRGAQVTGIDNSEEAISRNRARFPQIKFERMNACSLDFPDSNFDFISSVTVLQHMPHKNKEMAVSQMKRCLKQGGYLIILEQICPAKRKESLGAKDITFPYPSGEWLALFQRHGFRLICTHKHLFFPLLNNVYIPIKVSVTGLIKRMLNINSIRQENSKNGRSGAGKSPLSRIENKANRFAYLLLVLPSYLLEYILLYLFRADMWVAQDFLGSHQAFIFQKENEE